MKEGNTVIELKSVSKVYKLDSVEVPALHNISLKIKSGDFVSIMGPSGSGKSTLLHMIGALDRPTSGKVFINGRDLSSMSDAEVARTRGSKIGFVFQVFNLYPTLTAFQNVELPMIIMEKNVNGRRRHVEELLNAVGLSDRMGHLPSQLSGGQKQRVAIARALANDPAFILADEPTGNLDSASGKEIMEMFKKLNREGRTIVIVTHDELISSHSKHVMKIRDGMLVGG